MYKWYIKAGKHLGAITRVKVKDEQQSWTLEDIAKVERENGKEKVCMLASNLALEGCGRGADDNPLIAAIVDNLLLGAHYNYFIPLELAGEFDQFWNRVGLAIQIKNPGNPTISNQCMERMTVNYIELILSPCDLVTYYAGNVPEHAYLYFNRSEGALVLQVISGLNKIGSALNFLYDMPELLDSQE